MESTGVYWVPLYEILETRGISVVVANARDVKHVPGRKTDINGYIRNSQRMIITSGLTI